MEMYGFASGFRLEEETVIRWLALGMVAALLGAAMTIPIVQSSQITWYLAEKYGSHGAAAGSLTTYFLVEGGKVLGKRAAVWLGAKIGARFGASIGATAGPWGALIGGAVGAVVGAY